MRLALSYRLFFAFVLGFLIISSPAVNAQEIPSEVVTGTIERLQKTLEDTGLTPEKRVETLHAIVFERLDLERLTDLILKPYQGKDKEEKLEAFRGLYREYMGAVWLKRIEKIRGTRIEVISDVPSGENQAKVKTKIYFKDGDDMKVSFSLNYTGGMWKVFDIDFGLLFSGLEHADFKRKLRDGGMEGLFTFLREKMRENQK